MKTNKNAKNAVARKKAEEQKAKKKVNRVAASSNSTASSVKGKGKSVIPQSKAKKK